MELYPKGSELPEVGKELNKPARIIFYNWGVPKKYKNNPDPYKRKLEKWARSKNAELITFDHELAEVCVDVKCFDFNL